MAEKATSKCPVGITIQLIGGKYKAVILWYLRNENLRFCELQRKLSKTTPKMLTQQLREMESDGLISRTVYPVVPPHTEYALTEFGRTIIPVIDMMCNWGSEYLKHQQDGVISCS